MAGRTRLPLSKTSRFYVFDGLDKAEVAAAKYRSSSQGKQATRPRAHQVEEAWCNNADSQQLPATERLYMLDTYLMKADATVVGVAEDEKLGHSIILDKTVFHPQGGGQPSDHGTITCGSSTMAVSMVRDIGGAIHHFGEYSAGSPSPLAGQRASLSLDGDKRKLHAVLHSAGHAVDAAMVAAVGPGVFAPLKGFHFTDSPYVEYHGTLPDGLGKDAFIDKLNRELEKLVSADIGTVVKTLPQELEESDSLAPANVCGGGLELGSEVPRGGTKGAKHGAATRIVTVAGLACPCGGTHVSSTGQLEGVRVTKVKAKKGALRVSYTLLA